MAEEIRDNKLFNELTSIIEKGKKSVVAHVNRTLTLAYCRWDIKLMNICWGSEPNMPKTLS